MKNSSEKRMSPRFFHLRRLVPLLVSFFLGCFVTVKILDYRHPTLETLRQERKLEFNNEANSLLHPKLLKTKRVNTDHPFTAWDLKLPEFYTKHEDIYSQVRSQREVRQKDIFRIVSGKEIESHHFSKLGLS